MSALLLRVVGAACWEASRATPGDGMATRAYVAAYTCFAAANALDAGAL